MGISATAIEPFRQVQAGTDLAAVIVAALRGAGEELRAGDVLAVAHKVVSKAEGRTISLADVVPGVRARELAQEQGKDPRHVQVVLQESRALLRAERGVLICVTHHGFVCANAGVD
ncbi:MAG: coenzyme F420-0:L-glutamate ligase, partial [Actinomycetota bacterium]|nr:coenzyme F420-0:L-glutamate ligase [Actinomycetota bacterium]